MIIESNLDESGRAETKLISAIIAQAILEAKMKIEPKPITNKKIARERNKLTAWQIRVFHKRQARNFISSQSPYFVMYSNLLGIDPDWAAEKIWEDIRRSDAEEKNGKKQERKRLFNKVD